MRTTLMLATIALAAAAAGGCARRTATPAEYHDPNPPPEEPAVERMSQIGRYGGRFVIAEISSPKTFNEMMANESSSSDITERIFASLASFDNAKQEIVPSMAKSWDVSPDKLTWTFHLRKGMKFSDGHPMTSDDCLFTFQVAMDEKLHPTAQDALQIGGKPFQFSAPDPYTFVVKTPVPVATVLETAGAMFIMPKHVLENAYKNGTFESAYSISTPPDQIVTSGPWRITQYVPGEKTVVGRNPYWFGVDKEGHRLPYLNEVVFVVVPDLDAADLKFRSGEVHGLDDVKPENYKWYEDHQKDGNFTLYDLGPDLNTNFFWFNLNKVQPPLKGETLPAGKKVGEPFADPVKYAWFKNPTFRRAVSKAIDRDAMIPSVFFGQGLKNWAIATPGNKQWYSPDLVHDDYDPAGAKALLASIGFKDTNGDGTIEDPAGHPVSFTLKTNSSNTTRIAMGNFIKDDLAKVGIKLTLAPMDFNTIIVNIRNDFQYDAVLLGLQSGVPPDPGLMQNVWRSSGGTHQWFMREQKPDTPEEARIDHLMDTIVTDPDLEVRRRAYKEVETIANQQGWIIWLPVRRQKIPISNRFGNLEPSILRHRILWNMDRIFVKAG